MITDTEYVLEQLRAHPKGRDAMQIISASIRDREVGCTVHSRVADLRAQGYVISCAIEGKTRKGRERYVYRVVSEPTKNDGGRVPSSTEPDPRPGFPDRLPTADRLGAFADAGVVDPPARVEQEQPVATTAAAPLDAPIPGQLRLIA